MKKFKRPQQGTTDIKNPEKEEGLIEWGALRLLGDIHITLFFENKKDADYLALLSLKMEGMLTDERAASHLRAMYSRYPRDVVGKAYNHLKYTPHSVFTK